MSFFAEWEFIWSMNREMKIQQYNQLAKQANGRLYRLKRKGYNEPRSRFKKLVPNDPEYIVDARLREVERFLKSPVSTPSGAAKFAESVSHELDEAGINTPFNFADAPLFREFLHSKQYARLRDKYGSDKVIEDFLDGIDDGKTPDLIMQEYDDFLSNELSDEEINVRFLRRLKW